jgi:hypothetical protein
MSSLKQQGKFFFRVVVENEVMAESIVQSWWFKGIVEITKYGGRAEILDFRITILLLKIDVNGTNKKGLWNNYFRDLLDTV